MIGCGLATQAELKKKYIEEQLPAFLKHLEAMLVANKGGNGFFVGDAVSNTEGDANIYNKILVRLHAIARLHLHCKCYFIKKLYYLNY